MGQGDKHAEKRDALQARLCGAPLKLPATVRELEHEIRSFLIEAADEQILGGGQAEVRKLLKRVATDDANAPRGAVSLFGGEKNFQRDRSKAHFKRNDGAWFDFVFTLLEQKSGLTMLAYDAEIRFPGAPEEKPRQDIDCPLPPYVRYDLNFASIKGGAEHGNAERGLRSHCHPGHDALQAPSPLFHPVELLDLLVYGLRWG